MGDFDDSSFQQTLGEMLARASNPEKPAREIKFLMVQEMKTNIAQGGRPDSWPPSKRVLRHGGQTLRVTGELMNTMDSEITLGDVISIAAGPTAPHIPEAGRRILAYGKPFPWRTGQKKGGAFPARDYTYIPPETTATFGDIVKNYLLT
jgi:phage gpG-like protein